MRETSRMTRMVGTEARDDDLCPRCSGLMVDEIKPNSKPPFDPRVFLARVGNGCALADYKKKRVVFSQGEPAYAIFYIQEGKVKLTVVSPEGKGAVIGLLGVHDFFGESCLLGRPRRSTTATAVTDCQLVRLEKAQAIRAFCDEPSFSELFRSWLLFRNARLEEDLVDQLLNFSERRLARALLMLANCGKQGTPEPVVAKISHEMLSEMIGTTRARVSFFMNKFRKLGLIDYNGGLHVHSSLMKIYTLQLPAKGEQLW